MKIKLLALLMSAVVAVGGVATVTVVNNTPEHVAITAITEAMEDLAQRDEIAPLLNAFKEGSIEASVSDIEVEGLNVLEGLELETKMYFAENAFYLENFRIAADDKSISASVYVSEDSISISENDVLDASVGIVKGEAADAFEDSIFAYGSDSDFELDEETTKSIITLLEAFDSVEAKDLKKDGEKVFKKYFKELYEIVCDNAEFESDSDKIKLNGERKNVRVITITFDADAVAGIITDFYDFLCEDDDLIKLLDEYEDSFRPVFDDIGYDEDEDASVSELYEDLLDELEPIVDEIDEAMEMAFGDDELVFEIATPNLSTKLLKLTVGADRGEFFSIDFGPDGVAKTDQITVVIDETTEFVYEVERKNGKTEATFTVDDEEILALEIDKDGDFELALDEDDCVITGTMITKGNTSTITIEEIEIDGAATVSTDITLIIKQKDKMPDDAADFDTLDEITEEDIESWAEKIEEFIGSDLIGTPDVDFDVDFNTPDEGYESGFGWSYDY